MIGARAEASFVNAKVDMESAQIFLDIEVGNDVVDSGIVHVRNFPEIANNPEIKITREAVLLGGTRKGTHAKIWLTPDSIYWHRARGCDYLEGFSRHDMVCNYDLLYVGIAKQQDSYKRLIKDAHHGRLKVLSQERARKPGSHPSDEIILFLYDIEPVAVQTFSSEDDDFSLFNGADTKRVIADAEKAFIKLLDPKYNVEKFKNYPRGDDGLYGVGIASYGYSINENMQFRTANKLFKGHYNVGGFDNRQDSILVRSDEVKIHYAEETALLPLA